MFKKLVKFYAFLTRKLRKFKNSDNEVYKLSAEEFSKKLNEMDYKADPLGGLIDYVADPDKFFDPKRKFGRDCDDWARQWTIWGLHHDYIAEEYIVYNPKHPFKTMHVVTLLWKDAGCYLANYYLYGPFQSNEDALDYLKNYKSYKDGLETVFARREVFS